ncbi:MAG: hypothetical protein C0519_16030 [Hyphomicrobium sp.]|nr:hypothetical protein [Hyphomicrobium sp.]
MFVHKRAVLVLGAGLFIASVGDLAAQIVGNPLGNPPLSNSGSRTPQGGRGFDDDDVELGTICRSQRATCKLSKPLPVGSECQCTAGGNTIRGLVAQPRR